MKCPFALLLAPQALSNSLGIAVIWSEEKETPSSLVSPRGTEGNGTDLLMANSSPLLQIPSFNELVLLSVWAEDGWQRKDWGPSSSLFLEAPDRASGSYCFHVWCFCQHFKTAGR